MVFSIKNLDLAETAGIAIYPAIKAMIGRYLGAWGPVADIVVAMVAEYFKGKGGQFDKFVEGVQKGAIATLIYTLVRQFIMPRVTAAAAATAAARPRYRLAYATFPRWRGRRIIV